jgi:hypothetical protein
MTELKYELKSKIISSTKDITELIAMIKTLKNIINSELTVTILLVKSLSKLKELSLTQYTNLAYYHKNTIEHYFNWKSTKNLLEEIVKFNNNYNQKIIININGLNIIEATNIIESNKYPITLNFNLSNYKNVQKELYDIKNNSEYHDFITL